MEEVLPGDLASGVALLQEPERRRPVEPMLEVGQLAAKEQDGSHDDGDPDRPADQAGYPAPSRTPPPHHGFTLPSGRTGSGGAPRPRSPPGRTVPRRSLRPPRDAVPRCGRRVAPPAPSAGRSR